MIIELKKVRKRLNSKIKELEVSVDKIMEEVDEIYKLLNHVEYFSDLSDTAQQHLKLAVYNIDKALESIEEYEEYKESKQEERE